MVLEIGLALVIQVGSVQQPDPPINWTFNPSEHKSKADIVVRPGDKSVEESLKVCMDFLKCWNKTIPGDIAEVSRSRDKQSLPVQYYHIMAGGHSFLLDANSGHIGSYQDGHHYYTYSGGQDIDPRFKDAINTKGFMNALSKQLGCPGNYELTEFVIDLKMVQGQMLMPRIKAQYELKPYGYRLMYGFSSFGLKIDPRNGELISYGFTNDPYIIESHVRSLTESSASEIAGKAYKNAQKKYRARMPLAPRSASIVYVVPNGMYRSEVVPKAAKPYKMRLAWVIPFDFSDEVWVDAGDGKILGGKLDGKGGGL